MALEPLSRPTCFSSMLLSKLMQAPAKTSLSIAHMLSRRPAVSTSILFITGIVFHRSVPALPAAMLALIGVFSIGALITLRHAWVSCGLLALAIGLAGVLAARLESYYPANH